MDENNLNVLNEKRIDNTFVEDDIKQERIGDEKEIKNVDVKTYSDEDFIKKLEEAREQWQKELEEKEAIAKLSDEERTILEKKNTDKKIAELEAKLLQKDLKDEALTVLSKGSYPIGLADILNYNSKSEMQLSLDKVTKTFNESLEIAINNRLKGKTPEGIIGVQQSNTLQEQIARNLRGGL